MGLLTSGQSAGKMACGHGERDRGAARLCARDRGAMRRRATGRPLLLFILLLPAAAAACFRSRTIEADLILTHGLIHTVAPGAEKPAAAIAVRQGRLLAVGEEEEVLKHRGTKTPVVDLKGATVVPGLIDANVQLLAVGETLLNDSMGGALYLDLADAENEEDVVQRVRARTRALAPGDWVLGKGWNEERWQDRRPPDKRLLSDIVQNNPVFLVRADGHTVWVNKRALDLAGIGSRTPDPPGGRIERFPRSGEPTGILLGRAWEPVFHRVPPLGAEDRTKAILLALQRLAAMGYTLVGSAGSPGRAGLLDLLAVGDEEADLFRGLALAGRLPVRVALAIPGPSEAAEGLLRRGPELGVAEGRLDIRTITLFLDGVLASRSAALMQPYADDLGESGVLRLTSGEIASWATRGLRRGVQIAVRAAGDAAVHAAAEGLAQALAASPSSDARFRVEPLALFDPADLAVLVRIGAVACVQPRRLDPASPGPIEEARVGAERAARLFAYGTLLESGLHLAGASDANDRPEHPLLGFYRAVTRRAPNGLPPAGWHPEQRLGRPEALRLFTLGAAYALLREHEAGSLEPGKWADFTVLSQDLMAVPEDQILKTEVLATYVAGREVFRKER